MKWVKAPLFTILSAAVLWLVGCGEESPLSSEAGQEMAAPAAKLTASAAVAGACELPNCRPGFGGTAVNNPPVPVVPAVPAVACVVVVEVGDIVANLPPAVTMASATPSQIAAAVADAVAANPAAACGYAAAAAAANPGSAALVAAAAAAEAPEAAIKIAEAVAFRVPASAAAIAAAVVAEVLRGPDLPAAAGAIAVAVALQVRASASDIVDAVEAETGISVASDVEEALR